MKIKLFGCAFVILFSLNVFANCSEKQFKNVQMTVCSLDLNLHQPVMIYKNAENKPYKNVANAVKEGKQEYLFLMNAGMYHHDLSPVGLYIENGITLKEISTTQGPGNFHLMPNGVFYINYSKDGQYSFQVKTTEQYLKQKPSPYFATQSGPMLVIDNNIHPKFIQGSDSRFIRNGVGVRSPSEVFFVISQSPINFYDFASFFKEELKTPNALYFDGKISTLYAPPLKTQSTWFSVGPLVGAVLK